VKERFEFFTQKLLEWNRVHNLTGAKSEEDVKRNIEDSLKPLEFLQGEFKSALDVGTGAGFPGLILAMAMPQTHWILSEPRKKRAAFLNYIKTLLDLKNVDVAMKRVEELEPQKVDLITSRAVMKTKDLIKLVRPFIKPDTTLLLYKGEDVQKELDGLKNYKIVPAGKRNYLILKGSDVT
jgi:16S rRNA (guanine527-N7)-methyltransferase